VSKLLAHLSQTDIYKFRKALIDWGSDHFRPFPWRSTEDPYKILVAEVMLHRTQVSQVVPIYLQFLERFPDPMALKASRMSELRRILYSLGLRWRIELIHKMGVDLVKRFGGRIPTEKEELKNLPGVSDYIANAVRCFAWNLPEVLLDTNTVRIVARIFGLRVRASSRRSKEFRDLLGALLDPKQPRAFNYALLDLADAVCTLKQPPATEICPLSQWCMYTTGKIPRLANADPGHVIDAQLRVTR